MVPVDGKLLSPEAILDKSSLTGESLPVTRRTGDDLLSGSLNGGVAIVIRATARVEDSQYQRIVALVEEAGGTLEHLARIRTVAFDKTGTLTYGQPALDAVNPVPPMTANELLALAASAEQYSSHVLAASVLAAAETRDLSLQNAATAQEYATPWCAG